MHQNNREIRAVIFVGVRQLDDALVRHCAFFDKPCVVKATSAARARFTTANCAPSSHDQRISPFHVVDEVRFRQRSHEDGHHVITPSERRIERVPAADHTGDSRQNFDFGATLKARVQMHERAVEKRVAFARARLPLRSLRVFEFRLLDSAAPIKPTAADDCGGARAVGRIVGIGDQAVDLRQIKSTFDQDHTPWRNAQISQSRKPGESASGELTKRRPQRGPNGVMPGMACRFARLTRRGETFWCRLGLEQLGHAVFTSAGFMSAASSRSARASAPASKSCERPGKTSRNRPEMRRVTSMRGRLMSVTAGPQNALTPLANVVSMSSVEARARDQRHCDLIFATRIGGEDEGELFVRVLLLGRFETDNPEKMRPSTSGRTTCMARSVGDRPRSEEAHSFWGGERATWKTGHRASRGDVRLRRARKCSGVDDCGWWVIVRAVARKARPSGFLRDGTKRPVAVKPRARSSRIRASTGAVSARSDSAVEEDSETPYDPGQTPADLVVLSFSDSDLGAFAAGWHRGGGADGKLPTLRLCNLTALRHPASVDNYVEQTLTGAKGILIRLIVPTKRRSANSQANSKADLKTAWPDPTTDPLYAKTMPSTSPPNPAATPLSPCNPNAAQSTSAKPTTTTSPASRATSTCLSTSGCARQGIHALIHIGAHGTLEWLPGKSVALSDDCWPEALTADLPVIYPFIVNDPGEAAQAKRRIGAVTLGETDGLLTALDGKFVTPGPSGSPYRGRSDVLPTGRNLYAVDPRSVPTRAAHAQGVKLAEELIRRHLQDEGDYPKGLVVDLWGSATMRTAGEEVAMALHLAGLFPQMGRRERTPGALALAEREEAADMNPYKVKTPRAMLPKTAPHWKSACNPPTPFAHIQDLTESDVLLASDYASHEGGFAAAMAHLGASKPAMYHVDTTKLGTPTARTMAEEIARVVRARAANPDWASGMMRHAFRGAAEIAATLDNLAAFAHLTRDVPAHLFDLYYDATLGRDDLTSLTALSHSTAPAIPHKFGFAIDTGTTPVLQTSSADIRLERSQDGTLLLIADGMKTGKPITAEKSIEEALALAQWFMAARAGENRMAKLLQTKPAPEGFTTPRQTQTYTPSPGMTPFGPLCGLAFGQLTAGTFAGLAALGDLRITPWRMILIEGALDLPQIDGLITDPNDPLIRITACTGAPACSQAQGETRQTARTLAPHLKPHQQLHISGCAKGCAHPKAAPLTLTATPHGFDLVKQGRAGDTPALTALHTDAIIKAL
ncbi:Aerobic cobaltochelatase subunit CobN [Nymphon striatum]|nr:Aerobic cobaltochelatase subunit CobN [Nymphon striatum]